MKKEETIAIPLPTIRRFPAYLRLLKDYEAVKNSLIYKDISNGPLEGTNSQIKMKHRRGGGRAGMELINAYNVLKISDLAG
jgi:transposase